MKKLIFFSLMILSFISFAEIKQIGGYDDTAVFYQFTHDHPTNSGSYTNGSNAGQNWLGAQTIKLHVGEGTDVWLSNYVQSWYEPILALDKNIYDMSKGSYGAYSADGTKSWVGTGATTEVTFEKDGHTNTTEAYFLGHFKDEDDVYLWMTTIADDGHELVTSEQFVKDENHNTTLVSRVDGTHDLADNVRLNFGIDSKNSGLIGREFVAFGVSVNEDYGPSGQPLPGVLTSMLISAGVIGLVSRKRRKQI